jgi:hypothetical protein
MRIYETVTIALELLDDQSTLTNMPFDQTDVD